MNWPSWRFYLLIVVSGMIVLLSNVSAEIGFLIGGLAGLSAAIWEERTKTGWNR